MPKAMISSEPRATRQASGLSALPSRGAAAAIQDPRGMTVGSAGRARQRRRPGRSSMSASMASMAVRAPAGQARQRVRQRVFARPAHIRERTPAAQGGGDAHQPVAAVLGRTEDGIVARQGAERHVHMARGQSGNVAADHDHRARRHGLDRPVHAAAQIAAALGDDIETAGPGAGPPRRLVGRYRDMGAPAPVPAEPAQRAREQAPVERQRRPATDLGRQPGLDPAQLGPARHHHEGAPHP